jgi:hypothetical protein
VKEVVHSVSRVIVCLAPPADNNGVTSVTCAAGAITLMSLLSPPHAFAQTNQPLTSSPLVRRPRRPPRTVTARKAPNSPRTPVSARVVRGTASEFRVVSAPEVHVGHSRDRGGAAAAAAHPIDGQRRFPPLRTSREFGRARVVFLFRSGQIVNREWLGSRRRVQVGTYLDRPHTPWLPLEKRETNKVSATPGPDLIRAELVRRGAEPYGHQGQRATRPSDGRVLFVSVRPQRAGAVFVRRVGARTATSATETAWSELS